MNQQQQKRQKASARQRAEKQSQGGGGSQYLKLPEGCKKWKPKGGVNKIRILPYVVGEGNPNADPGFLFYERTFYIYRGIGPNEDTIIAPARTFKERDPVAEFAKELQNDPVENKEMLKNLRPKERQIFNLLDLEDLQSGVQIYDVSNFAFGDLLDSRIVAKPDKFEDFWDAETGMDLEVTFSEEAIGGDGKFLKAKVIDFEAGKSLNEDQTLERTHCLDDCLVKMDYEVIYKLFHQADFGGDAPGEESTEPSSDPAPWDMGADAPESNGKVGMVTHVAPPESKPEPEPEPEPVQAAPEPEPEPIQAESPAADTGGDDWANW